MLKHSSPVYLFFNNSLLAFSTISLYTVHTYCVRAVVKSLFTSLDILSGMSSYSNVKVCKLGHC